jgi:hypothetical protein
MRQEENNWLPGYAAKAMTNMFGMMERFWKPVVFVALNIFFVIWLGLSSSPAWQRRSGL